MTKIVSLPRFDKEMERVYRYILSYTKNETIANNIYNEIIDDIERLRVFPNIGQIEPDLKSALTVRSLVILKNYKIYYFVKDDIVFIYSIWDCRRNPQGLKL